MLLGKSEIDTIEVLTSKALIDSYINHDEFVSVNRKYKRTQENSYRGKKK